MQTPFEQAQAAFRKEVAATFHKKEPALHIDPVGEDYTGFNEFKTGDLLAFEAQYPIVPTPKEGTRQVVIRGFASPAGDVVLEKKNNLGRLLRAAQFLDEKQSMPALALAQRLIWMLLEQLGRPESRVGPQPPNHQLTDGGLFYLPGGGQEVRPAPPAIVRRPDGSASLVFFYTNLESIGSGLISTNRAELCCDKDYQVTIIRTPLVEASPF